MGVRGTDPPIPSGPHTDAVPVRVSLGSGLTCGLIPGSRPCPAGTGRPCPCPFCRSLFPPPLLGRPSLCAGARRPSSLLHRLVPSPSLVCSSASPSLPLPGLSFPQPPLLSSLTPSFLPAFSLPPSSSIQPLVRSAGPPLAGLFLHSLSATFLPSLPLSFPGPAALLSSPSSLTRLFLSIPFHLHPFYFYFYPFSFLLSILFFSLPIFHPLSIHLSLVFSFFPPFLSCFSFYP